MKTHHHRNTEPLRKSLRRAIGKSAGKGKQMRSKKAIFKKLKLCLKQENRKADKLWEIKRKHTIKAAQKVFEEQLKIKNKATFFLKHIRSRRLPRCLLGQLKIGAQKEQAEQKEQSFAVLCRCNWRVFKGNLNLLCKGLGNNLSEIQVSVE